MLRTATAVLALFVATTWALAAPVTFDWALVGNAGNAPDPETGHGAVDYAYRISKTELTNTQYVTFLNAVDPTGANLLDLWVPIMAGNEGGVEQRVTNSEGERYVVKPGREQEPAMWLNFFDAMRFVNWLENGQGSGGTESGVYEISDGVSEVRSPDARYWIPNLDEWYKAAYHDASAGLAGEYFLYPTGSNEQPVSAPPDVDPAGVNYRWDDRIDNGINEGYVSTGSLDRPVDVSPYTDVGAYTEAASPYGTFDQGGNAWEWNDSVFGLLSRGYLGGNWDTNDLGLRHDSDVVRSGFPSSGIGAVRLATVPEAGSLSYVYLATICAVSRFRRRLS